MHYLNRLRLVWLFEVHQTGFQNPNHQLGTIFFCGNFSSVEDIHPNPILYLFLQSDLQKHQLERYLVKGINSSQMTTGKIFGANHKLRTNNLSPSSFKIKSNSVVAVKWI